MKALDDRAVALERLFQALEAAPYAHDFFALLRRIEGLCPASPRLGCALRPAQEALRLGQEPELGFAPAGIAGFSRAGAVPRLAVHFLGLLGPQGPLPLHLTEYVRERTRQRGDATLQRFLDLFHHRLLALFYRAWAQSQPCVQQDRPQQDRYAAWLGAATGLDALSRPQDTLPQNARLFHAGLLGMRTRPPEGLVKILQAHFGLPARVLQWQAQWLAIAADERSRLGTTQLGRNGHAGSKLWAAQHSFRLRLGPLSLAQYLQLLPGGSAWRPLCDWVRQYAGLHLLWDVQLCLRAGEPPEPRLDRRLRLGLTAWLGRSGSRGERADLRLRPQRSFIDLQAQGATP